jgi:hypothetical protein
MFKQLLTFLFSILMIHAAYGQDGAVILSTDMFHSHQRIFLAPLDGWIFRQGNDPSWADPELDVSDWKKMNLTALSAELEDETGKVEGWFRIRSASITPFGKCLWR